MLIRRALRCAPWLLTAVLATACSARTTAVSPRTVVADEPPAAEAIDTGPTYYEGDIGGLSEEDVDAKFIALRPAIERCLAQGAERDEAFGGRFVVSLRINRQGRVKSAHLSESTLGDRDVETCVLDRVRAETWPKPLSGDGLATQSFEVDAVAPPVELGPERARLAVRAAAQRAASCDLAGRFVATAYVGTDGKVVRAGLATPSAEGEASADCVLDAVRAVRFGVARAARRKIVFSLGSKNAQAATEPLRGSL